MEGTDSLSKQHPLTVRLPNSGQEQLWENIIIINIIIQLLLCPQSNAMSGCPTL